MNEKTQAVFRGRIIPGIRFLDGRVEEVKVRQLIIKQYEKAYPFFDDEIALAAFICGKEKSWIEGTGTDGSDGMEPEDYETLRAAAREVNEKGFFVYASRLAGEAEQVTLKRMEAMRVTPDVFEKALMKAAQEMKSPSPTGSPMSPPRPV